MPAATPAKVILDRTFLQMRCRVLDLAADLDRLDRASEPHAISDDERLRKLRQAMETLLESRSDRAQQVQMIFSDPYESNWHRPTCTPT
jgi:hypothetical protein